MRYLILNLAIFIFLFFGGTSVFSQGRCAAPSITKIYSNKRVKLITVAKVQKVQKLNEDNSLVTVEVSKSWKADVTGKINYITHNQLFSVIPPIGDEFFFVFYQNKEGKYVTTSCLGSKPLADAASDIDWLNQK